MSRMFKALPEAPELAAELRIYVKQAIRAKF
jgi:hypothetical protein